MKPSVFISHNYKDKPFVRRLAEKLKQHGVAAWVDEAEITVGDSLIRKITEAIQSVDFVAVVISRNSTGSRWVRQELELAMTKEIMGRDRFILPLLIQKCEMPAFLLDKLYADFTIEENFDSEFRKLLKGLGVDPWPEIKVDRLEAAFRDQLRMRQIVLTRLEADALRRRPARDLGLEREIDRLGGEIRRLQEELGLLSTDRSDYDEST